jgi:hypothetical protein
MFRSRTCAHRATDDDESSVSCECDVRVGGETVGRRTCVGTGTHVGLFGCSGADRGDGELATRQARPRPIEAGAAHGAFGGS